MSKKILMILLKSKGLQKSYRKNHNNYRKKPNRKESNYRRISKLDNIINFSIRKQSKNQSFRYQFHSIHQLFHKIFHSPFLNIFKSSLFWFFVFLLSLSPEFVQELRAQEFELSATTIIFVESKNSTKKTSNTEKNGKTILTLQSIVKEVLEKNSSYQKSLYENQSKRAELQKARGSFYYPEIKFTGKYFYQHNDPKFAQPRSDHNISTSFEINKTLYNFGKLGAGVSIAKESYNVSQVQLEKAKSDLIKNAKLAFYGVILGKKAKEIREESLAITQDTANYQKVNYESGKISEISYLRSEIDLVNKKIEFDSANKEFIQRWNTLLALLEYPSISSLEELEYTLEEEFELGSQKESDKFTLASVLEMGQKNRLDLKNLNAQSQILKLQARIEGSRWKPSLVAFGKADINWAREAVSKGQGDFTLSSDFKRRINYQVGAMLTLSLSELIPGSSSQSGQKSLRFQKQAVDESLETAKKQAEKQITDLYLDLKNSESKLERKKRLQELSKRNFEIALEQYRRGIMDYLNYQNIELQYQNSQLAFFQELFQYNSIYLNFLQAVGLYSEL